MAASSSDVVVRVAFALAVGAVVSGGITATSGSLAWWCLGLTLGQAGTHLASSRDKPIGWTLGLGLQPAWISYSLLTHQVAFVLSAALIASGNVVALRRLASESVPRRLTAPAPRSRSRERTGGQAIVREVLSDAPRGADDALVLLRVAELKPGEI